MGRRRMVCPFAWRPRKERDVSEVQNLTRAPIVQCFCGAFAASVLHDAKVGEWAGFVQCNLLIVNNHEC